MVKISLRNAYRFDDFTVNYSVLKDLRRSVMKSLPKKV
jgi:hypothetical protein